MNTIELNKLVPIETILVTRIGSKAYNLDLENSDEDFAGVFVEDINSKLGVIFGPDSLRITSQDKGAKATSEDYDINLMSLTKFVKMAIDGKNPATEVLFGDNNNVMLCDYAGLALRDNSQLFVSRHMLTKLYGFASNAYRRLESEELSLKVNRPWLVEKYGYDVKFASYGLRAAFQGLDLVRTGTLHMPLTVDMTSFLKQVKTGQWVYDYFMNYFKWTLSDLKKIIDTHDHDLVPEEVDIHAINDLVLDIYANCYTRLSQRV